MEVSANTQSRWALLKNYFGSGQTVLHIGCGNGDFLAYALDQGANVYGIEADAAKVQEARQVCPVRHGNWEGIDLVGQYDSILLFHQLQHAKDPFTALERLRDHTTYGGRLFVEVPNLWNPLTDGFKPPEDLPPQPGFTPPDLKTLVEQAGWTITRTVPYQRTDLFSLIAHVLQGFDGPMQPMGFACRPYLQKILAKLDAIFRQKLVALERTDTLLLVCTNAEAPRD